MKKVLSLVLSAAFMLTSSSVAFGNETVDTISKQEAKKDAIHYLNISKNIYDGWKNAKDLSIGNERTLYDFDGNINAYLFSVTDGKDGHGYIIESAIPSNPGLLQASISGDDPYKKGKVDSDKGIYVGYSTFFSKEDNNNFIELRTNSKVERKELQNKGIFSRESFSKNSLMKSTPESNNIAKLNVNATTSSYYILGGIGNIPYTIVGCVPIAEANILKYWSAKSFPKLTKDATSNASLSDSQMTAELHNRMNTNNTDGGTGVLMAVIGSREYYQARGYNVSIASPSVNFNDYKLQLDNDKPVMVLTLNDHTPGYGLGNKIGYLDHALTGIGYQVTTTGTQYIVVFDGYESGAVVYPYNTQYLRDMITQTPQ